MARGNPNLKDYSPMVDNSDIDKEENAIIIQYALDIFNSNTPDLSDSKQVENTINQYFNNCVSKGLRPGNLGLYAMLGLDKRQVFEMLHGRITKGASVESIELIKKACKTISSIREMLGSQGKLNPATLIFWQKNFDGLEDVQRMELTAENQLKPEKTPEEIQKMLEEDIPIDTDYKELK